MKEIDILFDRFQKLWYIILEVTHCNSEEIDWIITEMEICVNSREEL